ncbi:serine/arginine-rich splicing factor 2 isoform X1 [Folsomia candida]|uniref:Serine/arginine-rich splicing factor 2 n=1 Tax=Folsomia candida TaxID=158441 RepID=A0A226ETH8_FOLCA|nr:serine/arginine-rich splicing factor 2 isoform X1 [Folsomia candida]OXA60530.1 Serine/arginine-rich splicing factor 2 [Folsomia candida]
MSFNYGRPPPKIEGMVSLKVDNLTYRTTPDDLRRVFEKYGDVGDVYIPRDRWTRESRGFAFVRFYDRRDAEDAMETLDGRVLDGRELRVQMARYGRPASPVGGERRSRRGSRGRGGRSRSRSMSRDGRNGRRGRSRSRSGSGGGRRKSRRHSRSRSGSGGGGGRSRRDRSVSRGRKDKSPRSKSKSVTPSRKSRSKSHESRSRSKSPVRKRVSHSRSRSPVKLEKAVKDRSASRSPSRSHSRSRSPSE